MSDVKIVFVYDMINGYKYILYANIEKAQGSLSAKTLETAQQNKTRNQRSLSSFIF